MRAKWMMRLLRGIASAAWVGLASATVAQPSEPTYQFHLPAQSAGSALRLFGEVTHQQIIFSESLVKGKRSSAVVGTFTAAQALELLLARTGLKITRTEAGVFYIGSGTAPRGVEPATVTKFFNDGSGLHVSCVLHQVAHRSPHGIQQGRLSS